MRFIRQVGLQDCGVCCLYNITKYYGGYVDYNKLREMTDTSKDGTSIYNLIIASNKIGFNSKAYKCNINDLHILSLPLIALIKIKEYNHFVIIKDIIDDKVELFDPIRGKIKYTIDEFIGEWQNVVITFEKKGDLIKEKSSYSNYIKDIFEKNKRLIIYISTMSFLLVILNTFYSFYLKRILDKSVKSNTFMLFLIIMIFKSFLDYSRNKLLINFNHSLNSNLTCNVYKKIFYLPQKYHHKVPVGDIISRIYDLYYINDFINTLTVSSIIDLLTIFIFLFLILINNPIIFLITIIFIFVYIGFYVFFRNDNNNLLEEVKEKNNYNNSVLVDNLNGITSIKNLNIEQKIIDKQLKFYNSYIISSYKNQNFINKENSIYSFIESFCTIFILFLGCKLLYNNKLTIGELTYIYSLYISIFISIKNILYLDKMIINSKISFNNINNFLNLKTENKDEKISIKDIQNIKFEEYLINNRRYNISINKGEYILIHGISGIGKSTLFKSLIKEINNSQNNIFINDININKINDKSIKNSITYISQNEYIFNGTIKDNILMYKNINKKELNKILKICLVDKVLKNKKIDINYKLEDNGNNLSGGERKKILLARALARGTDFIILDEVFDEIDIKGEEKILNNIKNNMNKTIIVISHRCSNISTYNKVIEVG